MLPKIWQTCCPNATVGPFAALVHGIIIVSKTDCPTGFSTHLAFPFMRNLFFLLVLILLLGSCTRRFKHFSVWRLTASDRQVFKSFEDAVYQPTIFYFRSGGRTIRGWEIGDDHLPVTLLIHGAPSSMVKYRGWFRDSALFSKTKLVAVDRPGYGKSGYGNAETSIVRQAELLGPLVEKLSKRGPIVVYGASYGGPVAARLAMNHPGKISALVLQSASVKPHAEKTPRIAKVIRSPLGIVFPKWAKVATREKFAHHRALEAIQNDWCLIDCPVWILHGNKDELIYPENAEYALQQLAPYTSVQYTCFDSLGHRIFWEQRDTVKHFIYEALRSSALLKE